MAITTYAELQTAIGSWLARSDLTATIPDFITLFEAAANRRLRVRQQETFTTLATSSGVATLPTDYLNFREVALASTPYYPLEYLTPTVLDATYSSHSAGRPRAFTISGEDLTVMPYDDSLAIGFTYFQKIPPLATSLNWLLTAYPDVYLYGSLYHAYEFMLDLEKAAFRKAQRDEIFTEIEQLSNKTRGVGRMRVLGPTP